MRATYLLIFWTLACWISGIQAPLVEPGQRLILYALSHGSWWHLALNMLALLGFGLGLERRVGFWRLLGVYWACVVGAGLLHLLMAPGVPVIGASGGVFGLMTVYGLMFPNRRVWLTLVPMLARAMIPAYLLLTVVSIYMGWFNAVAHWAHLGGIITGFFCYFGVRK